MCAFIQNLIFVSFLKIISQGDISEVPHVPHFDFIQDGISPLPKKKVRKYNITDLSSL